MGLDKKIIAKVVELILDTKTHNPSSKESMIFLDADLSILGSNFNIYAEYAYKVRKEYCNYSDLDYLKGRKRVLENF